MFEILIKSVEFTQWKLKLFFRSFFIYFNEEACHWVKAEQEPCTESADQSLSSTILPSAIASTTATASATTTKTPTTATSKAITTTRITTSTTSFINQTAILIENQDGDTAETVIDHVDGHSDDQNDNTTDHSVSYDPHRDSCEILNSDWICSNGPINLSLCFKICSDETTEHKRCICKEGSCSWYQKGNQCTMETVPVPNLTASMNSNAINDASSMTDPADSTTQNSSGNFDFANFPSLDSKSDLMSLIRQINVNSSGSINVSFQLRWWC